MRLWALGYDFDDSIAYTEMHYVLGKYKICLVLYGLLE